MPSSQGPEDEQKEPYFLTGKARENTLDFKGAIEAFEKALEANPRNGSAHFELGLRYEKEGDYSAAIYHFERFLKLRPDSAQAANVKDRITANKTELSKTTIYAPITQPLQRDFDRLLEEVKLLRADNEKLRASQSSQPGQGFGSGSRSGQGSTSAGRTPAMSVDSGLVETPGSRPGAGATGREPRSGSGMRTYGVKAGDTMTSIAKKHGVKVDALMAVNPALDPKRMKVGQTVKIPAP